MPDDQLLRLGALFVLFLLSAFFSGSETALTAMDRLRVRYLVEKKRPGAERLESLLSNPERLLSAILIGNNLVNIAASVFATTLFIAWFDKHGELATILILTPLLLLFAEVCPKTYAARYPEKVCFLVLRPIQLVMLLLFPLVTLVSFLSGLLTRVMPGEEERPLISEDEIRTMISVGGEEGVVAKEQHRMLHGVFELSQIRVRDVMIPRTEVVGIELDTPFDKVLETVQQARHSRFPVFDGELDNIIGIIHSKEILNYVHRPDEFSLRKLARAPYFVPESKQIETLLQSFRRRHIHLAVVVDEYGGVEGIVTLEDVVEEIVGEIQDEYDAEEILFREIEPDRFLVDGSASIRTVNRRFGLDLSETHATTLAGFVLRTLGSIPRPGESCRADGVTFVVRKMVERRIEEIEMQLPSSPSGDQG
ncbi:HlyC/CorC family transporter [Geothermobacter hydrogeniphilus]|uniref:Transporter n=1 Tax=Geothermobacter hydrogeniphilus TaxID=1969733 RepID=A0A1X0YBG3_9BACT|nr:CNNM domain-containing protein [Geothermobacter hydrogeniphilus]ORJ62457.1 transporter [Geothermobacter hydrogeniphilus]